MGDPTRLVDEAYRAWNAGGAHAFAEFTTEDVELHDAPELPDAQAWRGRTAVVSRLEDLVAATDGHWADVDEIRPIGDDVLVSLTWRFEQSGAATLASVYHVVKVQGDRIARVRVFLDEGQANRAGSDAGGA
jgi:ketosteroid isomerase-like protein